MTSMHQSVYRVLAAIAILPTVVLAQEVVVDNDDGAPAYTETGAWSTSGSTGYNGGTYRYATAGTLKSATWTADLPAAGDYEVFIWYTPGSNRSTGAKYDITAADGVHTVNVNQRGGGYTWDSLGTFSFNAGSCSITLDAQASTADGSVIADAVRFGGESGSDCSILTEAEVSPGVTHTAYSCMAPLAVHVLEFDLADPQYEMEMGFSQGKRNYSSNEAISTIAARYETSTQHVVGAINASYSEPGLSILGMLGTGGNLISTRDDTWWDQQTYMLQQSGEGWMASDLTSATMTASFAEGATVQIDVLDLPCPSGQVTLFTPDWDTSTRSTVQGLEVVITDVNYPLRPNKDLVGTVYEIRTGTSSLNNSIPANGLVLAAGPGAESEILPHVSIGEPITIRFDMSPAELVNMKLLCTGNAWMVKDGAPWHGGGPERHPRTVLAWSGTKHWFVTFDGRQSGYSIGANVEEMQNFLIDTLHVDNAVNLDGGGSTTMVVEGFVVNCPSDGATPPCTGYERLLPNALLLIRSDDRSELPMNEEFASTGPSLEWDDKFTQNRVTPFTPSAPQGDGYALKVLNPAGGFETVSTGDAADTDGKFNATIFCEYRPDVAADGFERVGLFARDDGNANFDSTEFGGGNAYALTFDSHDGRIRAGVIADGIFTDFLESTPLYMASAAWRDFNISCNRDEITFSVDDVIIASVTDATHSNGRCGIGYHEYFNDNNNAHGAMVDRLSVNVFVNYDWDDDGDVDLSDYIFFANCMAGPGRPPYGSPGWSAQKCLNKYDGDNDGDLDLNDFVTMSIILGNEN